MRQHTLLRAADFCHLRAGSSLRGSAIVLVAENTCVDSRSGFVLKLDDYIDFAGVGKLILKVTGGGVVCVLRAIEVVALSVSVTLSVLLARYANKPRAKNASICSGIRLYIFTYTFRFVSKRRALFVAADLASGSRKITRPLKVAIPAGADVQLPGTVWTGYDELDRGERKNQLLKLKIRQAAHYSHVRHWRRAENRSSEAKKIILAQRRKGAKMSLEKAAAFATLRLCVRNELVLPQHKDKSDWS